MATRTYASVIVALCAVMFPAADISRAQDDYGPQVRSFLELMRHEEAELNFQIRNKEISQKDYLRTKNRMAIHRQTVLDLVRDRAEDKVPEIHVVATPEVNQLIENGTSVLKNVKQGDVIGEKWRYLGQATRGEVFHIFERLVRN